MNKKDFDILNDFNILYIEDEEELLKHTTSVLEDFAKNIYAVKTCKKAFEILNNHQVDVIISDILLDNESGIECLKHVKNGLNMDIPMILASAYTNKEFLMEAIELKIEKYIVKPISIKELINTLHDIFLPKIQQKKINHSNNIIKLISMVTDGKQVELINFIINNLDDEDILNYSYSNIMEKIDISKPTIIKIFKQLLDKNILVKIQNGKYYFNEKNLG
jgi:CheY-like chemotaxis protein